jgi:hypothetical protein
MDGRIHTCVEERLRRGLQAHLCAGGQIHKTLRKECIVLRWSVVHPWARDESTGDA